MKQKEYKPTRQDKSREKIAGISTLILLSTISILLIYKLIVTLI